MANSNRAPLIAKAHKVLKQNYKAGPEHDDRPLLEQLLFACCLENAPHETATKVYDRLKHNYFDWNEVRVSTVTELAEAIRELPDPSAAAANLKRVLQAVFESTYSFDLELLKKQNIGAGIQKLQSHEGVTPFVLSYVVQHALAGHSIPLDRGALDVLFFVGIATPAEVQSSNVTGLERAIPKNKGVEFGSLLHQFAADYIAAPHSPNVKKILLAINSEATMPKRGGHKIEEKPAAGKSTHGPADAKTDGKPGQNLGKPGDKKSPADAEKSKSLAGDKNLEKQAAPGKPGGPAKPGEKRPNKVIGTPSGKHDRKPTARSNASSAGSAQAQLDKQKKAQKPAQPEKRPAPAKSDAKSNDKKATSDNKALPNKKTLPVKKSMPIKKPVAGKSSNGSSKRNSASKQLAKKKPR